MNGIILHTINGGQNWTYESTAFTTNWLGSVHFISTETGWAAGGNGTIIKTTNSGINWNTQSIATTGSINSLYFISSETVWASAGTMLKPRMGE